MVVSEEILYAGLFVGATLRFIRIVAAKPSCIAAASYFCPLRATSPDANVDVVMEQVSARHTRREGG